MYLLDTNICIDLQKDDSRAFRRFSPKISRCYIPTLVLGELYKGAYCSQKTQQNLQSIKSLIVAVEVIGFDSEAANDFGKIQDDLRRIGRPSGTIDALIAAVARSRNDTLVTHNTRHFKHIPNLLLEDWL